MDNAGLRARVGSWDTNATRRPQIERSCRIGSDSRSVSPSSELPARIVAPRCRNPMLASAVVLFPHPDSPANPRISPVRSSKLTSQTTGFSNPGRPYATRRPSTVRAVVLRL